MRALLYRLTAAAAVAAMAVTALAARPGVAAAAPGPHWLVTSNAAPTYFKAGDRGDFIEVAAVNVGAGVAAGEVTIADKLPAGVTATAMVVGVPEVKSLRFSEAKCDVATVTCTLKVNPRFVGVLSDSAAVVRITVNVAEGAEGVLANEAKVAGGAAGEATSTPDVPVRDGRVPYGATIASKLVAETGEGATQAGSHPSGFVSVLTFNSSGVNPTSQCEASAVEPTGCPIPAGNTKDIEVALPPGLVGNPQNVAACSQEDFNSFAVSKCPLDTQVGGMWMYFDAGGSTRQYVPVYNIAPPPGQPAELGFTVGGFAHIPMFFKVRTGGDYGLTADLTNISESATVGRAIMSIWGVPGAEIHDPARQSNLEPRCVESQGGCAVDLPQKPFLTLPTDCTSEEPRVSLGTDSWSEPGIAPLPVLSTSGLGGDISGCAALSLGKPTLGMQPTTTKAGSPAGYHLHMVVPQKEGADELATPEIRDIAMEMPKGTALSPSAANELAACSTQEFGLTSEGKGECPSKSIVGKVTIKSPLLSLPLGGLLYIGQPECAPCTPEQSEAGKMVRLYLEAEGSGVRIKLAGGVHVNKTTGQVTAVFEETPQLPFEELEVEMEEGANAPLVNPTTCGPIVAAAHLTPWSAMSAGEVTTATSNATNIEGCSPQAFTPSVASGMTNTARGGAFSGFAMTLSRPDGQQALGSVTLHMPAGLAGMLAKVPLCGEPQANDGTCSAASEVGSTTAVVGPGSDPYTIEGGKVYLTGPYGGAPFGLSIVTPAKAGPFTLAGQTGSGGVGNGNVVVRAGISVNPSTAAVTISSSKFPTQLNGIPLNIDKVIVNISRQGFMFNPTNCNTMAITGTVDSSTGTAASFSYPFQANDCAALPFHPKFTVLTHAGHSRENGAYLHVVVKSGSGQANIGKVDVELPKAFSVRDETLKQSCTEQQYAANPAGCPAGSVVGDARASTPILTKPLEGPAYFVSHAGKEFPNLDIVLQGEGVTIQLTGNTYVGKKGLTFSRFESVPDAPISRFDLVLPEGPHSALAGNGSFCKHKLVMPTSITGQNGARIEKKTQLMVTGCGPRFFVRKKHVHGEKATIVLHVPYAGKLVANGKGISKVSKRIKKHGGRMAITVRLKRHLRRKLRHSRRHHVDVTVHLHFRSHHHKTLKGHVKVKLR